MKISGFTFLRNADINGYPFIESIRSLLPLVEFVCAVGPSIDDTRNKIESIGNPKIKIVDTDWNENMRDRGFVYGQQKMIGQYQCQGDWAFYLEGDEVLHEADLEKIKLSLEIISTIIECSFLLRFSSFLRHTVSDWYRRISSGAAYHKKFN